MNTKRNSSEWLHLSPQAWQRIRDFDRQTQKKPETLPAELKKQRYEAFLRFKAREKT